MDDTYKVVFTGRLRAGFSQDEVVAGLTAMTNMDEEKATKFLASGRPTVMKKGVDRETADTLGRRLRSAGLEVRVVRLEGEIADVAVPPPSPPPPSRTRPQETDGDPWRRPAEEPPENPYASPMADLNVSEKEGDWLDEPQKVSAGRGWHWIREAVSMFFAEPWKWIAMIFLSGLITVFLGFIPIVGSFGTMLLGAVLAGGMMMGARDQEEGRDLAVGTLFRGFSENRNQLLLVGTLYLCVWLVFWVVFAVIMGTGLVSSLLLGHNDPQAMSGALLDHMPLFFVFLLLMVALSIPLMMAYWFATPLVALAGRTAWNAYKQSFSACLKNWLPFLVYGLAFLVVGILGMIGVSLITGLLYFFFGGSDSYLVALLPTVGIVIFMGIPCMAVVVLSLYAGFRDIFRRSA